MQTKTELWTHELCRHLMETLVFVLWSQSRLGQWKGKNCPSDQSSNISLQLVHLKYILLFNPSYLCLLQTSLNNKQNYVHFVLKLCYKGNTCYLGNTQNCDIKKKNHPTICGNHFQIYIFVHLEYNLQIVSCFGFPPLTIMA